MIVEHSSDIIAGYKSLTLANNEKVALAIFRDGKVLAITHNSLALLQKEADIFDELGNGVIASTGIADHLPIDDYDEYIDAVKAGYIGLKDGKAILITPVAIQLFHNSQDALKNHNEIAQLNLQ